jgi:hypothetical protein
MTNLGFGGAMNWNGLGPSTVGPTSTANASQLQQLLAEIQSQQQAGQAPSQLAQMQALTGPSPGGSAMGLPANTGGQMLGGPSAMPGNPGAMSPGQMLQAPGQAAAPPIGAGATSWPGMNGPATDPTATSWPGQGADMSQLSGTINPSLVSGALGLLAQLAGNGAKNKAAAGAAAPSAQSRLMQSGQNGALAKLLSGYGPSQMSGLMGAYGG